MVDADHQNDSTERVLKEYGRQGQGVGFFRPSKRLDRASTERVVSAIRVGWREGPSKRLDRASTESAVGFSPLTHGGEDHQNDSTERVLKEAAVPGESVR